METEGGRIRCRVPRPRPPQVEAALSVIRERKQEALKLLAVKQQPIDTKPLEGEFISPAEWEAQELNRIFGEHGTGRLARPFTAEDIESWRLRLQWNERWPDKPFGRLRGDNGSIDSAVGTWVSEQLRRAGTRFLRVNDKNSLAIWPEQNGAEFRLAVRLADLDHLEVYSRDEPRIQWLLRQQHPGPTSRRQRSRVVISGVAP